MTIREPLPFDTGLLNYNWQVWNCKAFSLYSGLTTTIDTELSQQSIDAVLRFMFRTSIIAQMPERSYGSATMSPVYDSKVIDEAELITISAGHAGIIQHAVKVGAKMRKGETLASIIDPYNGKILENVLSPKDGILFFATNSAIVLQNQLLYKIL